MPKLVINLSSHPQPTTVSQMRKRLAQVLSKLNGDQEVSFNFIATLENYQPTRVPDVLSRGLEAWAKDFLSEVASRPAAAAPREIQCLHPHGFPLGMCNYCMLLEADSTPTAVFGELARPENE